MTRQEHDTFEHALCPCGKGHILRHVDSTDYRYSSVHVSYSMNCHECTRRWRLEHGLLVLRESEKEYASAKPSSDQARQKLHAYAEQVVKSYCEGLNFKSRKAELEHLLALNLSQAKYAAYTKERRAGKEMYQLAFALRNIPWLKLRAAAIGEAAILAELLRANEAASKKLERASKQIVRKTLKGAYQAEA